YAPHQSHLVSEDDLDCDRGMTNYWEPAEQPRREPLEEATHEFQILQQQHTGGVGRSGRSDVERERGATMSFFRDEPPTSHEPEQDEPTIPPFSSRHTSGTPFGTERSFTYRTDDRYWTDYLRIAAPVLGVILMLGLAWFWINQLLGGGTESEVIPTVTATQILTGPTPTPSGTPAGLVVVTPPVSTTPTTAPSPTARTTIGPGATVVVANTDGAGVNLRAAPSTSADVVERLPEGTELTVVGESVSADGYVWWPVKYGDLSGYVVADYLELSR
ncbi:MAG: SH3 domain-containing protein, partial [Thermomicrobium sp.]|nr:SH3 domain-containing protein [Thermomicrobium sp.]